MRREINPGTSKQSVLLISRKWPPAVGGMETYSVELAASLSKNFYVRTLVLPGREDGHPPRLLSYAMFVIKAMMFCLLRGRDYDHAVFGDLVLFPAALCHWLVAPRRRRLVVVYGLDLVYQRRRGLLPLAYSLFFAVFRSGQSVFSAVVAISRYTATLATEAGLRNVTVVNPSLPRGGLVDADSATSDMPAPWQQAKRRVLYFGRLVPRKGSLWYAEQIVPGLPEDVSFFVVGQSLNAAFKERLDRCARTYCLGRVDNPRLAAMIRSADVVVMPNIPMPDAADVEGFGLAAIETSALGGRLLGSRLDGITDAIIDNVTGVLVEPENISAWTRATLEALAVPAAEVFALRDRVGRATREAYSRSGQADAFAQLLVPVRPAI